MAKRKAHKPVWYAEYDRLFVKQRPKRKRQLNRAQVLIVVLVALTPLAFRYWPQMMMQSRMSEQRKMMSSSTTNEATKYIDNYALKAAGLKRTVAIDSSRNLVAKVTGHTVSFSTGFQLTVPSSFTVEESARDHVVTPTKEDNGIELRVADFDGKTGDTYVQASLQLYGNLIDDFDAYSEASAPTLVKVFKTGNVGTAQTGYVFDIPDPKAERGYARLSRYFLFADGTGVVLKSLPDITDGMNKLTKNSSFAAFQATCGEDFKSLANDYTFTASN